MKQTPIEFLVERLAKNGILHSSDICEAKEMENSISQEYAEFAIRCDRMGMKILNFEDWIKL